MKKMFTLLIVLLLALAATAGYLILNHKINMGSDKIIAGEQQIKEGEQMLAQGKAKLSRGKGKLSNAKQGYGTIKKLSYGLLATLPVTGQVAAVVGDKMASDKIKEGDRMVAVGNKKVKAGEEQLAAGKIALQQGKDKMNYAKKIRSVCAILAAFFAVIFIVLGIRWRKSY